MNTDAEREAVGNPAPRGAARASRVRSLRPCGPGWRGLVLLLSLLYPALPDPAVAALSCDVRADCEVRLDRPSAEAAALSQGWASTTMDRPRNLDAVKSGRRRLTLKRTDDVLNPVEFEICGPQPLVDIFVEELEYHSTDLNKFDIYEVIAIIKEYFPCD